MFPARRSGMETTYEKSNMLNHALAGVDSVSRVLFVESPQTDPCEISTKLFALKDYDVERLSTLEAVPAVVEACNPNLLVFSVDSLSDSDLVTLTWLSSTQPIPIAVFARQNSRNEIKAIVAAGVSSYIVGDVATERLPVIFELAIQRSLRAQGVITELEQTKQMLENRKLIEKAKGIIMRQKGFTEDQAYSEMRSAAMNQGKSLAELSTRIISLFEGLLD